MKSILTFVLLSCFFVSNGQGLAVNKPEFNVDFSEPVNFGDLILTNQSDVTVNFGITLEPTCYQAGDNTKMQICAGILCFSPISESTTWGAGGIDELTIEAGASFDEIKVGQLPAGTLGSKWLLTFFDINDAMNTVSVEVNVDQCTPTSVEEHGQYIIKDAYPNPAIDQITIEYIKENNQASVLKVFNMLGQEIESVDLISNVGSIQLDLNDYKEGIHVYYITDGQSRSVAKTFIK